MNRALGLYSQCFIFFIAYEWSQQDRVLNYTRQERIAGEKHFSLPCPFISVEKMKHCEWGPLTIFTAPYFLCNFQMRHIAKLLHYTRLERLAMDKRSRLLGASVSFEQLRIGL